MKPQTTGVIDNQTGSVKIHNRDQFMAAMRSLAIKGESVTPFVIVATRATRRRTSPENRYYFGVIVRIFAEHLAECNGETIATNWSKRAHLKLRSWCGFREEIILPNGVVDDQERSTSTYTTVEFEEYAENCRMLLADEFKIIVPLPNEQADLFIENL